MLFFQYTTSGTLFKPVNLSNLVQQNSFIIVMALGMLLVIVSGYIDLSVGSVAGFIGALAAMMMVIWPLGIFSNPLVVSIVCLIVGALIGAAQGYWIAYHRIPSFIVTLAGMLIFRGICQALLGGGSSVGPLPDNFKMLSSGFIPDVIGPLTLIPPTVNAAGKTIRRRLRLWRRRNFIDFPQSLNIVCNRSGDASNASMVSADDPTNRESR